MANYDITLEVSFTDVNGDTARTALVGLGQPDATTVAQLATAVSNLAGVLQPCSNAKVTTTSASILFTKAQISAGTAPPPSNATFPSVTDGARLQFADSAGFRRAITVPAPVLSDFKTNSNVINPTDANIAALIAYIIAQGTAPDITNLYEGGAKVGRRLRRRVAHKSL